MATARQQHGNSMVTAWRRRPGNCMATARELHGNCMATAVWARAGGECRGRHSGAPSMARWLSREQRESRRLATSSSSTPRSERSRRAERRDINSGRRVSRRLSCGISSGSSSLRRRPSDQILDDRGESRGTPCALRRLRSGSSYKRRRPRDQVEPKLAKRRRQSDQVESAGASSPGQKPRPAIARMVGPASETQQQP